MRSLPDFFLFNISVVKATYLGNPWSIWRKMEVVWREKSKEERKRTEQEIEVAAASLILTKTRWACSSVPVGECWQSKEVISLNGHVSLIALLLILMKPLMSLMENSYKNIWFVFMKPAKKQRKMNTSSWFYPEAFLPVFLGFISLHEAYTPQEISFDLSRYTCIDPHEVSG